MTDQVSPGYRAASREPRSAAVAAGLVLFAVVIMFVAVIWAVAGHGRDALER
jgi:hypothetical protein